MSATLWLTGAAGWSGRHLIDYLQGLPARPRLVGLDMAENPPSGLDAYYQVDLCWPEQVLSVGATEPPSWVIHLAGAMPPSTEERMWQIIVGGTAGLLTGLQEWGGRDRVRILSVGSAAEYQASSGGPISEAHPAGGLTAYGRSKWAQSVVALAAAREWGMQVCIARSFNLIGPGLPSSLVAGALCKQFAAARDGDDILVGNTHSIRDFIDIRDAVEAYWLLVCSGENGEVYNVCSGIPTSIESLLSLFVLDCGRQVSWRVDPQRLKSEDAAVVVGQNEKLRAATGWIPRFSLAYSIGDMLAASRRQPL